jgi:predicted TIM-barrel fold metal-dependent hydrolase
MIIDCDTHFMALDAFNRMPEKFAKLKPIIKLDENGAYSALDFPGEPPNMPGMTPIGAPGSGAHYPGMIDMDARVKEYAGMGIDFTVLIPQFNTWWNYRVEPELAMAMAHSWNLAMLDLMKKYPRHVSCSALVALQHPEGAVKEMAWAHDQGFGSVVLDKVFPVHEHVYSEALGAQRQLRPFFAAAEALDIPIFLHAIQHGHRASNNVLFQKEGLDFFAPNEGQMSLVSLFTSGLLDAHPKLKFVYTEAGTQFILRLVSDLDGTFDKEIVDYDNEDATPFFRGRGHDFTDERHTILVRAKALQPPEIYLEKNKKPASHYFKNNFFFTIETEEHFLPEAVEFLGADRFLFATDYPHDDPGGAMKFRDVELLAKNKRISERDKERIRHENAREFLRIGLNVS